MQDQAPPEYFVFIISGWIGLEYISMRAKYTSEEYPSLDACCKAARAFRDGDPPDFRALNEPRDIYVARRENNVTSLRCVCEV